MKYYCDTNFIIRYLIADNEEFLIKTKEIFQEVKRGKVIIILEQTVFTEIIFVLSSFYKVPKDKIVETLSELLIYKGLVCDDKKNLLLALEIYNNHNLHIVDCILLAKTEIWNLSLLTFDEKLIEVKKLRNDLEG